MTVSLPDPHVPQPAPVPRAPVSIIVLTYNEEANIAACLASVAPWAAEVFVVDSGSSDSTMGIAATYTDHIAEHPFETYSRQRNWAQTSLPLSHEWVLHLDADERVTPELACSIQAFFAGGAAARHDGAMFSRRTVFFGRWIRHGGHYPVFHVRLFRRDRGRCEDRNYHQHFLVDGPIARLSGDLVDVVASDLDSFSQRHVRWAGAEARELLEGHRRAPGQVSPRLLGNPVERRRWLRQLAYGRAPLFMRAFLYFLYRYVVRRGFLDGREGLIFHFLQGCWSPFYVDAKIWEAQRAEMLPPEPDGA